MCPFLVHYISACTCTCVYLQYAYMYMCIPTVRIHVHVYTYSTHTCTCVYLQYAYMYMCIPTVRIHVQTTTIILPQSPDLCVHVLSATEGQTATTGQPPCETYCLYCSCVHVHALVAQL